MRHADGRVVGVDPAGHRRRAAVGLVGRRRHAERGECVVLAHEQRRRRGAQQPDDLAQDRLGHLAGRGLRDEAGREPVEGGRLMLAGRGSRLAIVHAAGLHAHHHPHREEGHERQPVLRVVHGERVVGRQEEEVPGKEGHDAASTAGPAPLAPATSTTSSRYSSAHWPLAKYRDRAERPRRQGDRQDGQKVPVEGEPGERAPQHVTRVSRRSVRDAIVRRRRRRAGRSAAGAGRSAAGAGRSAAGAGRYAPRTRRSTLPSGAPRGPRRPCRRTDRARPRRAAP